MSGVFNQVVDRTTSDAEKYALRRQKFNTEDVLPMWVADMDIASPPCVVEALRERCAHPIFGYEEVPTRAFDAQVAWMRRRGVEAEREWLTFSPSVISTINAAIGAFTSPGDEVIVQGPVYAPFFSSPLAHGRRVLRDPLARDGAGKYHFDLEGLKKKLTPRTTLLLLCSPHNPVGRVWRRDELMALAMLCLERGIKVVADEIHADLVYAPRTHVPFASLSEEARNITVTASGPGKTFNLSGLSISTASIADEKMREDFRREYARAHYGQGNVFAHVAFEAAYRSGAPWLEGLLAQLQKNLLALEKVCAKFPERVRLISPEGTYLAWLDCSGFGLDDDALARFFIEEARLGLSPGVAFGEEGRGFMRLNFAAPGAVMRTALERLEGALSRA